jgi:hypothetical protein
VLGTQERPQAQAAHGTGDGLFCSSTSHHDPSLPITRPVLGYTGDGCTNQLTTQGALQLDTETATNLPQEDIGNSFGEKGNHIHPRPSTKDKKLANKRRRRKLRKAKKKQQDQSEWDVLNELACHDREEVIDFMNEQGLRAGPPVFQYMALVWQIYKWAEQNKQDPNIALEDIENWRVRQPEPHPALQRFPSLMNCAEHFEKCWRWLAPQIQQRDKCIRAVAEDRAAEVVSDLYCYLFGVWDERGSNSTSTTESMLDLEHSIETGTQRETTPQQGGRNLDQLRTCNHCDPFNHSRWSWIVSTGNSCTSPPLVQEADTYTYAVQGTPLSNFELVD